MKSIGRSPSYTIRNAYSYCFRIRVPKDIQYLIGKKELKRSLKTGCLSEAKSKSRLLASNVQMIFKRLRSKGTQMDKHTDAQIHKMLNRYIRGKLEEWERSRIDGDPIFGNEIEHDVETLRGMIDSNLSDLQEYWYKNAGFVVKKILDEENVSLDPESFEYKKLCREYLKAEIKMYDVERNRTLADYSDDVGKIFPLHDTASMDQPVKERAADSITIETLANEYWKKNISSWKVRTVTEYKLFRKRVLDHFGADALINTIDYQAMEKFRDELKEKGNRGQPLSIKRVNMHFEFYHGMFGHGIKTSRITSNPVDGLILSDARRVQEIRDVFDKDDLKKIFQSKDYIKDTHRNAHNFWIPILALYTGARLEELCQLYVDDIKQVDGVWVLDVKQGQEEQSVKTNEQRLVPLHSFIVEDLNFIDYVRGLENQKGRVFPNLTRVNNRYGHGLGQWFGRYKKRCGIVSGRGEKVFHSFRHTVTNHLVQREVPEHQISMLVGHKDANITTGRYGKRFEPKMLLEKVVMKLDYDIDLSHLKKSKYVESL